MPARAEPPAGKAEEKAADASLEQALGTLYDVLYIAQAESRPYGDAALDAYLGSVVNRLVPHAGRPDLRFQARVIDSTEGNAFSLPGGHVYVTRGTLALVESEAELAAVLSHEVAHTAESHSTFSFRKHVQDFTDEPGLPFPEAAHHRDMEFQADRLGLALLRAAGYEARAMPRILLALAKHMKEAGDEDESMIPRLTRVARYSGFEAGGEVGRDVYLDHLDGLIYGDDPRTGALRGRTYLCGQCGLAFDLPPGWTAEQKTPNFGARGPGAAMSFHKLGKVDLPALLAKLRPGSMREETIAGLPTIVGATMNKEQPEEMAILRDGDEAYALMTAAVKPEPLLRALLRTVRRVRATDAAVRPERIRIRRTTRAGRFAEVLAPCGTLTLPVERLALLNGVESVGGDRGGPPHQVRRRGFGGAAGLARRSPHRRPMRAVGPQSPILASSSSETSKSA